MESPATKKDRFLVSGFWFLVSGFWFLVSGFWFLVSGFWFLVSGFWFLVAVDRWRLLPVQKVEHSIHQGMNFYG
jgi:hypothetical protein